MYAIIIIIIIIIEILKRSHLYVDIYLSWCHLSYDVIIIMEPLVLSVNLSLCILYMDTF